MYDEVAVGGGRTVVPEPKKREGLWFTLAALFPINLREPTKLDQSRLLWMEFQREARQPFPKLPQKPLSVFTLGLRCLPANSNRKNYNPKPKGICFRFLAFRVSC